MKFSLGYKDRDFLLIKVGKLRTAAFNTNIRDMATYKVKAMQKIMKQCRVNDTSKVWFFDDNWENIRQAQEAGFNAVWVNPEKGLEPSQIEVPKIAKGDLVLFDFDHTFATVSFGRSCKLLLYHGDIQKVITSCLGGKERLSKMRRKFTLLEKKGAKVGFLTYNSAFTVRTLLKKLKWIK